jgi:hypothetical protein
MGDGGLARVILRLKIMSCVERLVFCLLLVQFESTTTGSWSLLGHADPDPRSAVVCVLRTVGALIGSSAPLTQLGVY